jgi:hypothetical protein
VSLAQTSAAEHRSPIVGKYGGITSMNINAPDAGGTTATIQARATGP